MKVTIGTVTIEGEGDDGERWTATPVERNGVWYWSVTVAGGASYLTDAIVSRGWHEGSDPTTARAAINAELRRRSR